MESRCLLGDLAVVSIHTIEVVASTPSQGSTCSVADPSVVGLVSIRIQTTRVVMSSGMPTVHHTDRVTFQHCLNGLHSPSCSAIALMVAWTASAVYEAFFTGKPRKLIIMTHTAASLRSHVLRRWISGA